MQVKITFDAPYFYILIRTYFGQKWQYFVHPTETESRMEDFTTDFRKKPGGHRIHGAHLTITESVRIKFLTLREAEDYCAAQGFTKASGIRGWLGVWTPSRTRPRR